MPRTKPAAPARRFATDQRSESQLTYLRHAIALSITGGRPPSPSTVIRRALGLYTEHLGNLIESGHLDDLSGGHPQDAHAEQEALELAEYRQIVDAAPPVTFADVNGRLQTWAAAIQRDLGLAIPQASLKDA